tara:strand:+ start:154 stop:942 length:789 start_codon:yes stop_codon:yes gene_type:complete
LWEEYLDDNVGIDMSTFILKDNLNEDIWNEDHTLKEDVRERLLRIAEDFMILLELPTSLIEDVIITGSLANYNWSKYSDIDLHILLDFKDVNVDEELVRSYFQGHTGNWNKRHNIKMRGFEVEIYAQDVDEPHVSTGIYSVLNDKWVVEPRREDPDLDLENVVKKSQRLIELIDSVEEIYDEERYDDAYSFSSLVKEKIRKFRRCGLESAGQYSPENLAFKVLRRNGYLKKLSDIRNKSYDRINSVNENSARKWKQFRSAHK